VYKFCSAILLIAFSSLAVAQNFNYSFLEGGYQWFEFDSAGNVEGDGFVVAGSLALSNSFILIGSYEEGELDNFNVDIDSWKVGLGFHSPISSIIDLVVTGSVLNQEVGLSSGGTNDDEAFDIGLGLRANLSDTLELNVGLNYVDYDDAGDDNVVSAGIIIDITDDFAVRLGGSWSDDTERDQYTISGRLYLGN